MLIHIAIEARCIARRATHYHKRRYARGLLHSAHDRPAITYGNPAYLRALAAHKWGHNECGYRAGVPLSPVTLQDDVAGHLWYEHGRLSRADDQPTNEYINWVGYWREWRTPVGTLHRDGGMPASINESEDGIMSELEWYQNGKLHCDDDEPAREFGVTAYMSALIEHKWGLYGCDRYKDDREWIKPRYPSKDYVAVKRQWYINGELARASGEHTTECVNVFGYTRTWQKTNGETHRAGNRPARIVEGEDGRWTSLEWFQNGKRHRDHNKPACVDGDIIAWYKNGEHYRSDDGPHSIEYEEDSSEWYYIFWADHYVNSFEVGLDAYDVGELRDNVW